MKVNWVFFAVVVIMCLMDTTTSDSQVESTVGSVFTQTDNSSTVSMPTEQPGSDVHSSVQQWLTADKDVKRLMSTMVKSLLPHILRAQEDLNLSSNCSRGLMKFLYGLKEMKLWAFRMLDASGKIPNGLLSGSINALGDYDVCVDTVVPRSFRGQYCLVEVSPPVPPRKPFVSYDNVIPEFINVTHPDSVTAELMRRGMYYYHLNFRSSICVPSTCMKEEVQKVAKKVLELAGIGFDVLVPNCETKVEEVVFTTSEITILTVLSILVFLALLATVTDIYMKLTSHEEAYQKNLSIPLKCLMCFSFYTNGQRLLKKDDNPESIKIFHGMKVITILWVILNHTYYYLNYQALSSLLKARDKGKEFAFQFIVNGFLNVETFFFISAVLVAYGVTKMKGKRINIFLYAFRRFWRLTPPFMFVIACVYILPHLGSGPVWKETIEDGLTAKCKDNWWTNLLYFNNFISKAEMCMDWSWYIPVDTHLYFLSLLVLIPLKRNVKVAFIINGILLVVGIIISAASHIYYKLHPTAIYVYIHPDDINYYVDHGYYRSYLHVSSYCVGLTVGYILATKQKIQIPKAANVVGWITAFALSLIVVYGVYDWNQGNVPGMLVSTLYACTSKLVWSLALAWVTITCMTGNGGFATTILSWNVFVPFGRLTYMTYLIHPIIQYVYIGSTRTLIRSEHRTLVYMYCGNVVLSFMLACVFSLLFESPFMALEKVLFSSIHRKEQKNSSDKKDNGSESKLETNYSGEDLKNSHNVYTINFKQLIHDC